MYGGIDFAFGILSYAVGDKLENDSIIYTIERLITDTFVLSESSPGCLDVIGSCDFVPADKLILPQDKYGVI